MQSITVNGQHLEYEFHGEGPVVVLVNNPMVSLQGQRMMADPLVKTGRRVLVFEHHESSTMPEYVDALAGLLDSLELRSVCLWGWSHGAAQIQELAVARPDLAGRIVLLGTAGRPTAYSRMWSRAFMDSLALEGESGENIRSVIMLALQMTPAMLVNDAVVGAATAVPASPAVYRRAFASGAVVDGESRLDALASITAPALVIGFERDMFIPPLLGREVADAIKGARYVDIADATHIAPFTHTKQIMDVALPFLNEDRTAVA